jgi:hypothetical protein
MTLGCQHFTVDNRTTGKDGATAVRNTFTEWLG